MKQARRSNHRAYVPVDIMAKYGAMLDEAKDNLFRLIDYRIDGIIRDVRIEVPGNKVFSCKKCGCPAFKLHTQGGRWYECSKCGAGYTPS